MNPINKTVNRDDWPAMNYLCSSLGRLIEAPSGLAVEQCSTDIYEKSVGYARSNKLETLFSRVSSPYPATSETHAAQTNAAASIAEGNAFVLHIIRTTSDILSAAGIEHFFFKGPLQQFQLYGDFFAKRAADADLLVDKRAFERASNLLVKNGFLLPQEFKGLWWSHCLGERPLFKGRGRPSLDLHYRLQQPGCPPPRQLSHFFRQTESMRLGGSDVQVANLPSVALIAAINLVKGIYHREPCGNHAMDLCMALRIMSDDNRLYLQNVARLQGLERTLGFAARASALTFGLPDRLNPDAYHLPASPKVIRGMVISPAEHMHHFPKRRAMLYYLCDNKKVDFIMECSRLFVSETVRVTFK